MLEDIWEVDTQMLRHFCTTEEVLLQVRAPKYINSHKEVEQSSRPSSEKTTFFRMLCTESQNEAQLMK